MPPQEQTGATAPRPSGSPALTRRHRSNPRRAAKTVLILALSGGGIAWPARGVPILCYHSIDESGSPLSVSPSLFERQITLLHARGFQTITVLDLCRALINGESLPRRTVVLTFDDGYRNNHRVAMPILTQFGMTATIFVATDYVGRRIGWVKSDDIPDLALASWEELMEMSDAGLDIEPHTATHPNLANLVAEQVRDEILRSKSEIEERLGKAALVLAYPYGVSTPYVKRALDEMCFLGAVTSLPGLVRPTDALFDLPRMNVTGIAEVGDFTKMQYFRCCLSGAATWYLRAKACLRSLTRQRRPWEQSMTTDGGKEDR